MILVSAIATAIDARKRCEETGNDEWFNLWTERLRNIERDFLPRGSGFDSGTTIDSDSVTAKRIVLGTSFHHMHDSGMYDGWTDHQVILTPSFVGAFDLRVTGRNRNDIKFYIGDHFHDVLSQEVTWEQIDGLS